MTLVGERTKKMIYNPPVTEVDIVVATIGVMNKLVGTGIYKMDEVKHLVIDEADILFDETFCDYTCKFLRKIPVCIFFYMKLCSCYSQMIVIDS